MSKIIYKGIGYAASILPFIGTDGTDPGVTGLVPAPSISDMNKFLKSDGTWGIPTGGSGGTSDYEELINLPSINNHTLLGSMSLSQLGLIDFFYPIGSYYETSDADFDPSTEWGGTWTLVSSKDAYIVEEGVGGTDNLWHYRKWSDGVAEAWIRIEKTLTGTSTAAPWTGNMYNMGTSSYPEGLFLSAPAGTISGSVGSGYCIVSYMQFYNNGISTTLTSNVSGSQNCVIRAYAVGKWSNTSETYYRWHRTA